MEVGGIERGIFCNFFAFTDLRDNQLDHSELQLLFGFVWLWKISVFFIQFGTNMAQINRAISLSKKRGADEKR
jgi:hypothetical protein